MVYFIIFMMDKIIKAGFNFKDDFVKLIKLINRDNILDADIFFEKCKLIQ